jgi:H+/Na+-translocating ferredoxin:NAD+ oxidoreductase subunit C
MLKKSFFGLVTPWIKYDPPAKIPADAIVMPMPKRATLMVPTVTDRQDDFTLKPGDPVKTGQKLQLTDTEGASFVSTVSGAVAGIVPHLGDFGRAYSAVAIDVDPVDERDEEFAAVCSEPSLDALKSYLGAAPGAFPFETLGDPERPIHTLIVCGVDRDLLVSTQAHIVQGRFHDLEQGVKVLKQVADVQEIIVAVQRDVVQNYGHIDARLMAVDTVYPAANPILMMNSLLGQQVPAGQTCEDLGVCFVSAEAVAAIGKAVRTQAVPVTKTLTLIRKDGVKSLVSARIGTSLRDLFREFDITLNDQDRIIVGGPMTGVAAYSLDQTVMPDTDAVMVQDSGDIAETSDYPCVNCGDCVRICPTKVPVNMLVRVLEAGLYAEAADGYDLYSCIDCGLCSAVCVAKIPIFQYIKLGKYELGRINAAEAANE